MKGFFPNVFKFVLFSTFFICFLFTAHSIAVPIIPPTGDTVVECNITILILDESLDTASESFEITITDIAGGNQYHYIFTYHDYSNSVPLYDTIIGNTTYIVDFNYTGSAELILFDRLTDAPVDRFHATGSGVGLRWEIRAAQALPSGVIVGNVLDDEVVEVFSFIDEFDDIPLEGIYAEAAILWARFVDSVSHLEGNNAYTNLFRGGGELTGNRRGEHYADITGNTLDDWNAMPLFERFLWYDGYVRTASLFYNVDFDLPFSSFSDYRMRFTHTFNGLRRHPVAYEAFEDLLRWQYDYILANHTVYNFITGVTLRQQMIGESSFMPNPNTINRESFNNEEILFDEELDEALAEFLDELLNIMPEVNTPPLQSDESRGIWDNTIESLRGIWFTLIIAFLFGAAFVIFIVYKKRKEMKDFGDD